MWVILGYAVLRTYAWWSQLSFLPGREWLWYILFIVHNSRYAMRLDNDMMVSSFQRRPRMRTATDHAAFWTLHTYILHSGSPIVIFPSPFDLGARLGHEMMVAHKIQLPGVMDHGILSKVARTSVLWLWPIWGWSSWGMPELSEYCLIDQHTVLPPYYIGGSSTHKTFSLNTMPRVHIEGRELNIFTDCFKTWLHKTPTK